MAEASAVGSSGRIARAAMLFGAALLLPVASVAAQGMKAATPARSSAVRGTLFIVGGGAQPPELVTQFIALAGGPGHARIAIFPMASEDSTTGPEKKAELDSLGATSFVINVTRAQAAGIAYALRMDKKKTRDIMNYVLLEKIGNAVVKPIPMNQLEKLIYSISRAR